MLKERTRITTQLMECYCRSKCLYSQEQESKQYLFDGKLLPSTRTIQQGPALAPIQHQCIDKLKQLSELWVPTTVAELDFSEIKYNPLSFYKSFIARNTPCIIKNCFDGEDIVERWKDYSYLAEVLETRQLTVAATPDGFADSVKRDCFVQPHDLKMTMKQFLQYRENFPGVEYIQNQNNNLFRELEVLDFEYPRQAIGFISEQILQSEPDATNFWMGRSQSVSSMHKDPYENFYQVINGEKHFTLIPPVGVVHLREQEFFSSRWQLNAGQFSIHSQKQQNPWIVCNPDLKTDYEKFPELAGVPVLHVVVKQGDMLYLPSLWYHQVQQFTKNPNEYIIAINHWFDMDFGHNHGLYQISRLLAGLTT